MTAWRAVRAVGIVLCASMTLLIAAAAPLAQTAPVSKPTQTQTQTQTPPAAPEDPLGRTTPRGTVVEFLSVARKGDDTIAARYLNTNLRGHAAERLARQLFVVLDTRLPARLTQLSDQPEGSAADPLHRFLDSVGTIPREDGDLDIVLERVNRQPEGWIWLFSRKTLEAIPDVYDEVGRVSIESHLPAFLIDIRLGGVRLYEWAMLLLGPVVLYLIIVLAGRITRRWLPGLLPFPVRLLLLAGALHWVLSVVGFPILVRQLWSAAATLCTAVAAAWLLVLLNARTERYVLRHLAAGDPTGAGSLARVARRVGDVLIVVAVALLTLWRAGVNPAPALAGLGVGGIAVALAAQKTLENVIAGVSLIFDQALRVGDVLKINETVGTVVYIGLRSTRIRTLDRTLISVPNGQIANMTLEALSARDQFWFHPAIPLQRQTTPAQLRSVVDGIRRLLAEHPSVDRESVRVRFIRLGPLSLDIDVFAYVIASDVNQFLEIQEHLLHDVMEIIRKAGTAIAFPLAVPPVFEEVDAITDDGRRRL